jgi:hypothetical protein
MADKKITALEELGLGNLAAEDLFHVIDSPGSGATNKNIKAQSIFGGIPSVLGFSQGQTIATGGSSAISIAVGVTYVNSSSGAMALTLANAGTAGTIKIITMTTAGNNAVITPANFSAGTTLTMNAVGHTATLLFNGTAWDVLSVGGNPTTPAIA